MTGCVIKAVKYNVFNSLIFLHSVKNDSVVSKYPHGRRGTGYENTKGRQVDLSFAENLTDEDDSRRIFDTT